VFVILDFAVQQPQLSSIRRDQDELQKKIGKLQKQRDQCVSANKLSEVCASGSPLYSVVCIPVIVPTV